MTTRIKPITPFNQGQSTNEHPDKTKTAKINGNMSSVRNSGTEDGLHAALGHRIPVLPSDNHIWTHTTTVTPVGAHYSPAGEFGKRQRTGVGKGVYSYGGAPNKKGDNALGNNSNRKGGNPLGNALNRVGINAMGKNSNRRGSNAVGRPQNHKGEKSGYSRFSARGGGGNV